MTPSASHSCPDAPMKLEIVYLARLRDAFGRSREELDVPPASTVETLMDHLRARGEPWARELAPARAVRVAVNHEMTPASGALRDGDEVALLPPVTGG
jgi:molybdopterin synthase sulfur carrier subunit